MMRCLFNLYFTNSYKVLSIYTILLVVIGLCRAKVLYVDKCPTCEAEWTQRARNMSCKEDEGLYYHCILNNNDNLVELCLEKRPIPPCKGGCPYIHLSGDLAVHQGENSPCPINNTLCPSSSRTYYTNQLFKFPICFHNVSERIDYEGEHCRMKNPGECVNPAYHDISKSTLKCAYHSTNCLTWIVAFSISVTVNIATLLSFIFYCTSLRWRNRKNTDDMKNPNLSGGQLL